MTEVNHLSAREGEQPFRAELLRLGLILSLALTLACAGGSDPEGGRKNVIAKVRWDFQTKPGGERHPTEVEVVGVPENPRTVPGSELRLPDPDLVLGVVIDGKARAYPIRYLALSEIVDDWIGDTPVAPSW